MKTYKLFLFIAVLSAVLFSSCTTSKRDLNPKELIGGFELLKAFSGVPPKLISRKLLVSFCIYICLRNAVLMVIKIKSYGV